MSNDKLTKLERKAMERVRRQVSWQQLGDEFKDHPFCFHVLDQAQEKGRDWEDKLQNILSSASTSSIL